MSHQCIDDPLHGAYLRLEADRGVETDDDGNVTAWSDQCPETTHVPDPDDGHLVQVVSPDRLRALLDEHGDSYDRPDDFRPEDEWYVFY